MRCSWGGSLWSLLLGMIIKLGMQSSKKISLISWRFCMGIPSYYPTLSVPLPSPKLWTCHFNSTLKNKLYSTSNASTVRNSQQNLANGSAPVAIHIMLMQLTSSKVNSIILVSLIALACSQTMDTHSCSNGQHWQKDRHSACHLNVLLRANAAENTK